MMGTLNTVFENDHPKIIFVEFGSIWCSGFIDDFQTHSDQISLHLHILHPEIDQW
jgi:hypothetical protein